MSRRVEYSKLGGPEVLQIVEVEPPHPAPGEVRVRVLAAGINPFDAKVFRGMPTAKKQSVTFPMGNGSDFAGVIDELGEGVSSLTLGDLVMGARTFFAQADFLVIAANRVILVPEGLPIGQAGSLNTAGRTAWASVESLQLNDEDVVLVSAAAGGVGVIAVQLAKRAGATVIGSASESNHDFLRSLGVIPVAYGEGMADAVRAVAPQGITAALDNFGHGFVDVALELGAPASRINTIADYESPEKYGVGAVGAAGASLDDLRELALLVAAGAVDVPIDSVFPLERAADAYTRLIEGHLRGKIVLVTQ
ncbi:NADP-dependent oxidoreductase [Salinibacterium sp. G-O1]|uniref:NADP-dependent oxidoreductase n=1 Tax=Salinibacterium sp. G-O1 TaxID=3046208 RepID=UPI0024B9DE38|nr:NADP-dependent oxidoreductase [Salinibacterium sp. G-O1]MDJ0334781.1 NADP-dependent oxidoreductase [Salinibacterium sp. G-O1]